VGGDFLGGARVTPAPAITLVGLSVSYGGHLAVHGVAGCFERGSLTAIVGPNGAGKSTLLKAIVGLLKPGGGRIDCHGFDRRRELAYLPQQADVDRSFPITVVDTVAAGLWHRTGAMGGLGREAGDLLLDALAAVGLDGFGRRSIGSLSAGQFQRVLFARVLLQGAPIVLLDEPFNAIDARTTTHLLGLVRRWHDEGRTVIAVLHDLDLVRRHFPRSLLLARELIAWGATQDALTPANLQAMRRLSGRWDEDCDDRGREAS
jgi:zinc/manganese transport system ATP-binding protein